MINSLFNILAASFVKSFSLLTFWRAWRSTLAARKKHSMTRRHTSCTTLKVLISGCTLSTTSCYFNLWMSSCSQSNQVGSWDLLGIFFCVTLSSSSWCRSSSALYSRNYYWVIFKIRFGPRERERPREREWGPEWELQRGGSNNLLHFATPFNLKEGNKLDRWKPSY